MKNWSIDQGDYIRDDENHLLYRKKQEQKVVVKEFAKILFMLTIVILFTILFLN